MQAITKWKADDGREFDSEADALAHEGRCARVAAIMAEWPADPDEGKPGCDFANGGGYLQLSEGLVVGTRNKLLDLIAETLSHEWIEDSRDPTTDSSWVARLLSDSHDHCVADAWYRLSCVDSRWRWWGQPFYALNMWEGVQECLNPTEATP